MKLNTEIKTEEDRNKLMAQLRDMEFEKELSVDLQITHFRNGEPIVQAVSVQQFYELGEKQVSAFIKNENDHVLRDSYLYNSYAVNDERGLAPCGYHVPTNEEWDFLGKSVQNNPTYDGCASGGNPSNQFDYVGEQGFFWTSTIHGESDDRATYRLIQRNSLGCARGSFFRSDGFSVRVVKD